MYELPDEIWNYIKEFALDWKSSHKRKMKPILENNIVECYKEVYERWTYRPPVWQNTNDIIRDEYTLGVRDISWAPPPNLELTSITWNINSNKQGGWWCGYGWKPHPNLRREYIDDII